MSKITENGEEIEEKGKEEKDEWMTSILIAIVAAVIIRIFLFAPTIVVGPSMYPTLYGGEGEKISFFNFTNDRLIAERLTYFLRKSPKRGDIITFTAPSSESFYNEKNPIHKALKYFTKREYIKRVIGVGGDHVQIKGDSIKINNNTIKNYEIKGNEIYINGEKIPGNYDVIIENASVYVNGKKLDEEYTNGQWGVYLNVVDGEIVPYNSRNSDVNVDIKVPEGYVFAMGDNRDNSSDSRKFSPERNDYYTKNGCISLKEMSGRIVLRFWPFNSRFGVLKK